MGFFAAIGHGFAHYADFQGRARRSEYWCWTLFVTLVTIVTLYAAGAAAQPKSGTALSGLIGLGLLAFYLAIILPSLAVTVRRLHDSGKSGWWYLLTFLPFGGFVVLIFTLLDSEPGPNRFGPSPKTPGSSYGGRQPQGTPDWVERAEARAAEIVQTGQPAGNTSSSRRPPVSGGFGQRPTFGRRQTPPGPARA